MHDCTQDAGDIMNNSTEKGNQTLSERPVPRAGNEGRDRLARTVVIGSFFTIFLLVATIIAVKNSENQELSKTADNAFNAILPVLAGWVGTVLAFYFSSASQERTALTLERALNSNFSGDSGPTVGEKMIPTISIEEIQKLETFQPEKVLLSEFSQIFTKKNSNNIPISRIIFTNNNVFRHLVHKSVLDEFLSSYKNETPAKLSDFLNDQSVLAKISDQVIFVGIGMPLTKAKETLDSLPRAQDIIVTANGNKNAPMLGWLSNVDLLKALEAK